jgi:hypothetical protein
MVGQHVPTKAFWMFSMIFLQTSVCWLISLSRLVSLGVRRLAWMYFIDRGG